MDKAALRLFLDSPYNEVSDVKMYYFFADISKLAAIVILSLALLSVFIRNFWCRYLCPYGALLGLLGFLSPHKIKRNRESCIDCGKCARVCPSFIKVDQVSSVISDECTSCTRCIDACPVADTLNYRNLITGRRPGKKLVILATGGVFLAVTGFAMLTGNWNNNITAGEYLQHQKQMHTYGHPTGTAEIEDLKEQGRREGGE
jgi:polyferredoxin